MKRSKLGRIIRAPRGSGARPRPPDRPTIEMEGGDGGKGGGGYQKLRVGSQALVHELGELDTAAQSECCQTQF